MTTFAWIPSYKKRGESRLKLKPIDGAKSFTNKESCKIHIDHVKRKSIVTSDIYVRKYMDTGYIVQASKFEKV